MRSFYPMLTHDRPRRKNETSASQETEVNRAAFIIFLLIIKVKSKLHVERLMKHWCLKFNPK